MPSDDEIYDAVITRGRAMRRRRRSVFGASAIAAVVAIALAVAGLASGDGGEAVVADGAGSTTTATDATATSAPTTTSSSTETTVGAVTTTTEPGPSSEHPPMTTAPPPSCRNSRDPACGPFAWDPVPANEPIAFVVTVSPERPVAGQPVTVSVHARDPEAGLLYVGPNPHGFCTPQWGDSDSPGGCSRTADRRIEDPPRTGPWDPPAPVGASASGTFEHTYTAPGTYTVTVYALAVTSEDVRNSDYDVYGEDASDTVTITVR